MIQTLAFNKPYEVLCQFSDSAGKMTLKNFIPVSGVYAAGRLDYRSEGLLILTNDGNLIHKITDPKFDHSKTYFAQVEGLITAKAVLSLRSEILLPDQLTCPIQAEIITEPDISPRPVPVRNYHPTSWVKIILSEGKKHQVRRMTAAVGYPTLRLVRYAIGQVTIQDLEPGHWRFLNHAEVRQLTEYPR